MSEKIQKAKAFAIKAHEGQTRKYTGDPYYLHCSNVAYLVSLAGGTEDMIVAAWLHDTIEDTPTPRSKLVEEFGFSVNRIVDELTNVSQPRDGNRAKRKEIDRWHLARASKEAQMIKLADLIDNTRDIVDYDAKFAKTYLAEKRLLMEVLTTDNHWLWDTAWNLLMAGEDKLRNLKGAKR